MSITGVLLLLLWPVDSRILEEDSSAHRDGAPIHNTLCRFAVALPYTGPWCFGGTKIPTFIKFMVVLLIDD